jgi:hypothetical protein
MKEKWLMISRAGYELKEEAGERGREDEKQSFENEAMFDALKLTC